MSQDHKEQRRSYQTGIELESTNTNMVYTKLNSSSDANNNIIDSNGCYDDKKINNKIKNESNAIDATTTFDIIDDSNDDNANISYSILRKCSKELSIPCLSIITLILFLLFIGIVSYYINNEGGGYTYKKDDIIGTSSSSCLTNDDPISILEPTSSISNIKDGAVATDEKICSELSLTILQEPYNGNAVDAAITAALCLGVVNPASSGMGGGSFILVHMKDKNVTEVIDAREEAPSFANETMFEGGHHARLSLDGGLAIAIPGELKGLELVHKRHGILNWSTVVTPVIKIAKDGFPISANLANEIQAVEEKISQFPNLLKLLTKDNLGVHLLQEGDVLYQPALANTLQLIADNGADVLYKGEIAERIINEINAEGGIFTINDLKNYKPIIREPLISNNLNGFTIVGVPPPSSGGGVIIGAARFLLNYNTEQTQFSSFQHTLSKHRYVEALKHTFALRMSMSDPAFDYNNITKDVINDLVYDTDYINYLRTITKDDTVLPLDAYGGIKWSLSHNISISSPSLSSSNHYNNSDYLNHPNIRRKLTGFHYLNDHGTSSFSIIDKNRNAISMTSTVNTIFGSGVVSPSTGIIFNSDMDDFSSPNMTNVFGLQPSESNYIKPHKRPISSMSPTFIFRSSSSGDNTNSNNKFDKLFMALGSSGGPKIISAVLQTFLNHAILGLSLYDSVSNPRIHNQLLYQGKDVTVYDSAILHQFKNEQEYIQLSNRTIQALLKRNQTLLPVGYLGTCQAISVDLENDLLNAVSDIRKMGFPAGY